jgi:hypothetical protein
VAAEDGRSSLHFLHAAMRRFIFFEPVCGPRRSAALPRPNSPVSAASVYLAGLCLDYGVSVQYFFKIVLGVELSFRKTIDQSYP